MEATILFVASFSSIFKSSAAKQEIFFSEVKWHIIYMDSDIKHQRHKENFKCIPKFSFMGQLLCLGYNSEKVCLRHIFLFLN